MYYGPDTQGSKSGENKEKLPKDLQINVDDQTVVDIINPNVEREIQTVFVTADHNQPCCSWRDSAGRSGHLKMSGTEDCNTSVPSRASVSHTSVSQGLLAEVHKCHNHGHNLKSRNDIHLPLSDRNSNISTASLRPIISELFNDVESVNRPTPNSSPPMYLENPPQVPAPERERIAIVNIPNSSLNHNLLSRDAITRGPPPSYSKSLLDRRMNPCASIQFVAPIPPPSYDGVDNELRYAGYSGFTLGLGNTWQSQPQPAYCPICETVIITRTDIHISRIAHIFAMALFIILCWPFCLLPYFLNVCNYTFHYCSVCHSYLGARRPFQHS